MAKPEPQTVEVPFGTLDTIPPDHAGPSGRLSRMIDCEVQNYTLPAPGTLARMLVQPRGGFGSLTQSLRSSVDGTSTGTSWIRPELISSTGPELVSVDNSKPRVYNGTTWTDYGAGGTRVLTNKLSQSTITTSDATIIAPSSATIGSVTCVVWTEAPVRDDSVPPATSSNVGFRNSDGTWIVQPRQLQIPASSVSALVKVVADLSQNVFWVLYNSTTKILVDLYDTNGVRLAQDTSINRLVSSPVSSYWDLTNYPAVTLAQAAATSGTSGVQFSTLSWNGSSITVTTSTDTTINCHGPISFRIANPLQNSKAYLATQATIAGLTNLYAWQVVNRLQTHRFQFGAIPAYADSITGWTDQDNNGPRVNLAYSILSNFSPAAGPPNDPGLRYVRTRNCDSLDTVTDVSWHQQVINQSEAFQIDDDWYSVGYYQSGSGLNPFATTTSLNMSAGTNTFIGAPEQNLPLTNADFYGGGVLNAVINPSSATTIDLLVPTQSIASITHNAGDSVTNNGDGTATWVLLNASFHSNASFPINPPCVNSYLHVTGSSIGNNNTSFLVTAYISSTSVTTRSIGTNGQQVTNETLGGTTESLIGNLAVILTDQGTNPQLPANMTGQFVNAGTVTTAGSPHTANNGTWNVIEIQDSLSNAPFNTFTSRSQRIYLTAGGPSQVWEEFVSNSTNQYNITITCPNLYIWELFGSGSILFQTGDSLEVTGTGTAADSTWVITSTALIDLTFLFPVTNISSNPTIGAVPPQFLPGTTKIKNILADPTSAYTFTCAGASFDQSYVNAILTISNAVNAVNDGTYRIIQVLTSTEVLLSRLDNSIVQVNEDMGPDVVVTVTFPFSTSVFQPTWFIVCLSNSNQEIAGAFENMLAYADWRYDGSSPNNRYTMALTTVVNASDGSLTVTLPFRTQSWTTDNQIVNSIQTNAPVLRSSVGLKQFKFSTSHGQAVSDTGTMLLPGLLATQFGGKSFHEAGINLGPEKPFVVSQGTDGSLTVAGTYQYVIVWEISNDDGTQIQSIPSPALDVTLSPGNNRLTIGGRFVCPTNWNTASLTLVRATVYRTSYQNGAPTTQHYRLTSPIDPDGTGFVFSSVTGGPLFDTYTYKDTTADYQILSEPTLYTDALEVPRQAAPAYSQGVVLWNNHQWVIGYDGAIWMSSQPTEGLATYYSRLWRIPFPEHDQPVALAVLESYLLVFCQSSVWYLPQSNNLPTPVPDPADDLPTPVPTPFTNGCTGFVRTLKTGVAYSTRANRPGASQADELWFVTRNLENVWLGQSVQGLLTSITGLSLDNAQRLFVSTGTAAMFVYDQLPGAWYEWHPPSNTTLVTEWNGTIVYRSGSFVNVLDETASVDTVGGVITAIAPDVTFANINPTKVRHFMCCWAFQVMGQYLGPHHENVILSYPDEAGQEDTVFAPFLPDPTLPYLAEFNPMCIDASTFKVRIFVDFNGLTPGPSAKFEFLNMEVGVMPGRAQVRQTGQIMSGSGS